MIGDDRIQTIQGVDYLYEADMQDGATDPLVTATLTIRNNQSDTLTYVLQKTVTSTLVSGVGQITDSGAGDGMAVAQFYVLAAESLALSPRSFAFTVLCTTASGANFYAARGIWTNSQP
ncbi:MAG: hypothetical protein H0X39_00245 [Actinobacteria bacterium]|nr:hypothetical protein [Actinomycetota bacterium]